MTLHQFSAQFESFRKDGIADDPSRRGTVMSSKKQTTDDERSAVAVQRKRSRGDVTGEFWGSWAPPEELAEEVDVGATQAALTDEEAKAIEAKLAATKRQCLDKEKVICY